VAAFDVFTVALLIAVMMVPGTILLPEIVCPTARLVVGDTEVRLVLPLVTVPVIAATTIRVSAVVLLPVAGADRVTVLPLIPAMVVPAGMKLPAMDCPTANPVVDDTEVTLVLPLVTMPAGKGLTTAAGGDRVMDELEELIEPTIVPAGMVTWLIPRPVAAIGCPTAIPVRLDNPVIVLLPAVRVPLDESAPLLATPDIVIVFALELTAVMVVPGGMPVPEIGSPATTLVKLDTDEMVALPLVRVPVGFTVVTAVVAAALFDMVITLPIAEIVVPDGTPVPVEVIGCPTTSPLVLDTDVMLGLPLVRRPENVVTLVAVAGRDMTMVVLLVAGVVRTVVFG
jgi:hypothetical protein